MTIRKHILDLTPDELTAFVAERRINRLSAPYKAIARKPKDQTIAKLARDLGIDKYEVARRVKEVLGE